MHIVGARAPFTMNITTIGLKPSFARERFQNGGFSLFETLREVPWSSFLALGLFIVLEEAEWLIVVPISGTASEVSGFSTLNTSVSWRGDAIESYVEYQEN
jgi:hypothetical protein